MKLSYVFLLFLFFACAVSTVAADDCDDCGDYCPSSCTASSSLFGGYYYDDYLDYMRSNSNEENDGSPSDYRKSSTCANGCAQDATTCLTTFSSEELAFLYAASTDFLNLFTQDANWNDWYTFGLTQLDEALQTDDDNARDRASRLAHAAFVYAYIALFHSGDDLPDDMNALLMLIGFDGDYTSLGSDLTSADAFINSFSSLSADESASFIAAGQSWMHPEQTLCRERGTDGEEEEIIVVIDYGGEKRTDNTEEEKIIVVIDYGGEKRTDNTKDSCAEFGDLTKGGMLDMLTRMNEIGNKVENKKNAEDYNTLAKFTDALLSALNAVSPTNTEALNSAKSAASQAKTANDGMKMVYSADTVNGANLAALIVASAAQNGVKSATSTIHSLSEDEWAKVLAYLIKEHCDDLTTLSEYNAEDSCFAGFGDLTKGDDGFMGMVRGLVDEISAAAKDGNYALLVEQTVMLQNIMEAFRSAVNANDNGSDAAFHANLAANYANYASNSANLASNSANSAANYAANSANAANYAVRIAINSANSANDALNEITDDQWANIRAHMMANDCDALMAFST